MSRNRNTLSRDFRFDDWRRDSVPKGGEYIKLPFYSTDLDEVITTNTNLNIRSMEYTFADGIEKPLAFVDYKHSNESIIYASGKNKGKLLSSLKAQLCLSHVSKIPMFIVWHDQQYTSIKVQPLMVKSWKHRLATFAPAVASGQLVDFCEWHYRLRGLQMPDHVRSALSRVRGIDENGNSIDSVRQSRFYGIQF